MNSETASNLLQGLGLFSEFSESERQGLAELVESLEVKAGQTIVKQDEKGDCMFVLLNGNAKVVHQKDDESVELFSLAPGDFFGEIALVDEGPRSANVEAKEDCQLLKISQADIRALAGVYPRAAFKLLIAIGRVMVQRMRQGNQKYIDSILLARRS